MLENLFKATYLMFNQIKVVHSIPGRLRLSVPNLSKIPEELKKYDYRVTELILSKKGIKSIEYSYVTNKILLYYDVKLISEKQILDWLNKVWKTMINHSELYENKSLKEIGKNSSTFIFTTLLILNNSASITFLSENKSKFPLLSLF